MVIANHYVAVIVTLVRVGRNVAAFEFVTTSIGPHPLQYALLRVAQTSVLGQGGRYALNVNQQCLEPRLA